MIKLSGFSRQHGYQRYHIGPEASAYSRVSARKVDLPAFLITYALQPSVP